MNESVTEAMANAMAEEIPKDQARTVNFGKVAADNKVLAQEVVRLQDWFTAILQKMQAGPVEILVPPKELLRTMKRKDVYQEAASLGYQEAGELAAEALGGLPAPDWVKQDKYVDPDDEEDDDETG